MGEEQDGSGILLLALREIDCAIPAEIDSVAGLTAPMLVEAVARCLLLITGGAAQFAVKLPSGAASKHRVCTQMARELKSAGFPGECSFNQLLYPSDASTRALLTFLVEKLPRAEDSGPAELTSGALLDHRMTAALHAWAQRRWVLPACPGRDGWRRRELAAVATPKTLRPAGAPSVASALERIAGKIVRVAAHEAALEGALSDAGAGSEGARRAHAKAGAAMAPNAGAVRAVFASARRADKPRATAFGVGVGIDGAMSFSEVLHAISVSHDGAALAQKRARKSRFAHATEFAHDGDAAAALAAALAARRAKPDAAAAAAEAQTREQQLQAQAQAQREAAEATLSGLQDALRESVASADGASRERAMVEARIRQLEAELAGSAVESDELEKRYLVKRKALEMLPNAADNVAQLQTICGESAQRLMEVGQEWEAVRAPLLHALRQKKGAKAARVQQCKAMMDDIRSWRGEMSQMALDVRAKEERVAVLADELAKLPKNLNRTLYTYRIMDIIGSISKQKKEIAKIITDIRQIQKEINLVSETLTRTEALADEMIFQEANKDGRRDPAMVQSYRHLSDIRQCFEELISLVSQIGLSEREAQDVESRSKQLQQRTSSNNQDQIMADLQQVKQENLALIQQIKSSAS